ncbi:MAG: N-6 DNA methylase [Bacteroidales bacterium]|nr:N-6 DNA methylase [Bacteroidales bacterium]
MTEDKILSIPEAAEVLQVSEVTVRNWIKSGLLDTQLSLSHVSSVKKSISNGEIQRLNKRANKTKSSKSFVPSEYVNDKKINEYITQIISISNLHFKSIEETIYNIAISYIDEKELDENNCFYFKRDVIQKVFDEYNEPNYKQDNDYITAISPILSKLKNSHSHDILGLIYQSFQTEGSKSQKGSYYTPVEIINEMIGELDGNVKTFLDPCCGTGAFILSAIKIKNIQAENIYGADIDKTAVFLARINILEFYKNFDKVPNIFHLDSLNQLATGDISCETNYLIGKIDAIATNPPWGAGKNTSVSAKYEKIFGSREIFSMFLLKSIELLSATGELHFLLPESILNIKTHKNIRNILCTGTKIISIKEFGRVFTGVYTPVISIHAKIAKTISSELVKIRTKEKNYTINQDRFLKTKHNLFDIKIDNCSKKIIDKIYSIPHITLKNNASWALGIVTGNNKKFLQESNNGDLKPIYKGSDINYYYLKSPSNFIKYNRQAFQQVSKDKYFSANEKLVYKFISNKLVFAYDNKQSLTLNSANILIPNLPDIPIKVVLAFLNSTVFQFLHKIKFSTHKILRGNLEELPFPKIDDKMQRTIINYVNKAIDGDAQAIEKINEIVFQVFELDSHEIRSFRTR